jgi:uncharacterized membrane-anchored protein
MNKTQKGAWFNLVGTLLCFALGIYIVVEVFILRRLPEGFGRFWGLLAFWLVTGIAIIFIQKKQSPAEVDSDERDNFIKKRAVLASFVSVWILLFASSIIPRFIVGPNGSIPVWILPIINLCVLLIVMLIYSAALLIQYSRGGQK